MQRHSVEYCAVSDKHAGRLPVSEQAVDESDAGAGDISCGRAEKRHSDCHALAAGHARRPVVSHRPASSRGWRGVLRSCALSNVSCLRLAPSAGDPFDTGCGARVNVCEFHQIDPLCDPRWVDLVERCDESSLFHTRPWLEALKRSYGFEPVAFVDAPPGKPVQNGILFCRVLSWMTGRRLISLPFSDHCEALGHDCAILNSILESSKQLLGLEGRYIELRPTRTRPLPQGFEPSAHFAWHSIDLRPELDEILRRFHKSHTQRAIRKAERVGVIAEAG